MSGAKRIVCLANSRRCRVDASPERHLTIHLGEPYEDAFYKLVAAIIEPDRRW